MGRIWRVLLVMIPIVGIVVLPPLGQRLVTLVGIYALLGLSYPLRCPLLTSAARPSSSRSSPR